MGDRQVLSAPCGTFGRSDRLRTRGDFDLVMRKGRRVYGRRLGFLVCPGTCGGRRLGLAVSRGAGPAVARARLRRLIREAFRSLRGQWPDAIDVVVTVRRPWPDADLAAVCRELSWLAGRAQLKSTVLEDRPAIGTDAHGGNTVGANTVEPPAGASNQDGPSQGRRAVQREGDRR